MSFDRWGFIDDSDDQGEGLRPALCGFPALGVLGRDISSSSGRAAAVRPDIPADRSSVMTLSERFRRLVPGLTAVALALALFVVAQAPVEAAGGDHVAAKDTFVEMPIAFPPYYQDSITKTVRTG